jgi:uncharacterized membrane protein YeaQ/YmgE (transglycosylase-associated protein family)
MPILLLIVLGAATGFLATRIMKVETDVITTILIGIAGAVVGWVVLRFLLVLSGWVAIVIGALIGAIGLIWLWKMVFPR